MENGSRLPTVSSRRCPNITSDAFLLTGPSEGALGSPESPQGAEFNKAGASERRDRAPALAQEPECWVCGS